MLTSAQWLVFKYLVTSGIVVLVSELARRSDRLGAFIAALPLVTVLTLVWLYVENQGDAKLANHAWFTFWYALPTLPMFLLFPWLVGRYPFWWSLGAAALLTVCCFGVTVLIARQFGVELL